MNVKTIKRGFFICFMLWSSGLFALTVEKAVEYALKNSKTLQSAAIDLEIKTRAKNTAWNVLVPSVQISGTMIRNNEVQKIPIIPPTVSGTDSAISEKEHWKAAANIGVSFHFNAASVRQIAAARADYETGLVAWEQVLAETERSIRKLFYGLLLQQESLSLQRQTLENAQSRAQQAETSYKNGLISELSFLQSQVAYENQKPIVLKAEQDLKQQLDMFAFLLGLSADSRPILEGSIEPVFIDLDPDRLISEHLKRRSDLLALQKNIELLRIRLSAMNLQTFTPSLSLNYSRQPLVPDVTKNWFKDGNSSDSGSFSVSIAWTLTDILPFAASRQQAKNLQSNLKKLEIQYTSLIQNGETEIRTLTDKLKQNRTVIEAGKSNSDLAQRACDMTREAYRNGTTELLEVRDAEAQLNQARLSLASEKYNYLSNLLDLEYALNTKLSGSGE